MEKSEPALAPGWLKVTGNISGGGNTSHHPASSSSHSDDHGSILSSRNQSSLSIDSDYDSPRHLERSSSSNPFRRSISTNGSSLHGKDSSLFPLPYSWSHRDKDCDKDFPDYDRERSILEDYRIRDYSDPMGVSHSSLSSRIEKDRLRRSHSMISGKRSEGWPKKVTAVSNSSKTNSHNINNVNIGGTTVINNIHKTTFDRNFPFLGAEERQGIPEIGRVSSPGLGSASQSVAMGTPAVLTDGWTSALVEPPPTIGSTNIALTSAQQSSTVSSTIPTPSSTAARNMAEALALAPPRARIAPQLSVETQRLEELAIKQSRQLIPVTPSMPKASVLNSEKQKPKATGRNEMTMANKIGQQHLASNHHVHAPLQAGPARIDAARTSHGGSSLQVLKPTREKNGISPNTKEGSSPTNANRVVSNSPLIAAPPSAPLSINNPKLASSAQRKASPQRSNLDKRITTSQAQSRTAFFNNIKKQTTANSSSAASDPDPVVSSTSPKKSEEVLTTESGATGGGQCSSHAIHPSNANCLKLAAVENGGDDTRSNGKACPEETNQGYPDNGGVKEHSIPDALVYPDDEEVAFLRSLGWDENALEEGLTAEEINSFYETVQCKKSAPSFKPSRRIHLKVQLVLEPQEVSAPLGSSSCDSEQEE